MLRRRINGATTGEGSNLTGVYIDYKLYEVGGGTDSVEISSAKTLQPTVAKWYKTFRNIAIVSLLSILVYVGIRITLSSISSDKAKYKQMLMDWVVALCLVFLMHYIMAFAVTINEKIIKAVSAISGSSAEDKIKAVENAKNDILDATTGGKAWKTGTVPGGPNGGCGIIQSGGCL